MIVISDLHAGSIWGLTPPNWHFQNNEYSDIQKDFWDWFSKKIEVLKPFDILVSNGDAIDGVTKVGIDHLTNDLNKQVEIAKNIIDFIGAKKHYIVHGTPFHVTDDMNAEDLIAEYYNTKPKSHLCLS